MSLRRSERKAKDEMNIRQNDIEEERKKKIGRNRGKTKRRDRMKRSLSEIPKEEEDAIVNPNELNGEEELIRERRRRGFWR
jgi:hypothetical protein